MIADDPTAISSRNVAELLRSRASTRGGHVAFRFLPTRQTDAIVEWTYDEIDRRASALAAELAADRDAPAGHNPVIGLCLFERFFALLRQPSGDLFV